MTNLKCRVRNCDSRREGNPTVTDIVHCYGRQLCLSVQVEIITRTVTYLKANCYLVLLEIITTLTVTNLKTSGYLIQYLSCHCHLI